MRPRQSSPAQVCSDRVESDLHLHVGVLVCGEQLQGRGTGDHLYCSAAVRLQCSTYCTAATVPYSVGSHLDSGHRGPPWRCNHGVVLIVGDRKKELKQTSVISPFKQTSVICDISTVILSSCNHDILSSWFSSYIDTDGLTDNIRIYRSASQTKMNHL